MSSAPQPSAGAAKGTTIGRYIVLGLIGRGGMGEVYAAYDPELDRKIAVKLLRAKGGKSDMDNEGKTRLLREAQAIARLSHPNVVIVHDVGTFRESVFIAMEFVEGHTLGYWTAAAARSWREVLDVYKAAGKGLEAAHVAGLVHRDFKPDNVMLTKGGQVRVMDFGLAREQGGDETLSASDLARVAGERAAALAEAMNPDVDPEATAELSGGAAPVAASSGGYLRAKLTETGIILGTPAYMAPEQFAGTDGDARTDQFAFCVALYEGLYRQRPFEGNSAVSLMANVVAGAVTDAPEGTRVPTWIRKVLLRGLAPDPKERYPSMTALLGALGADPAAARRRWWGVAAGVVLALVAVGGARWVGAGGGERMKCTAGPVRAAAVWGQERARAIERAFAATRHPDAARVFARSAKLLDQYIARWVGAYKEACEATQVRGEQSQEVLDLRMGCLGERLSGLRALADLFATADKGVVDNAIRAAGALPAFDRCDDVAALRAVIKPPEDPATRERVATLREEVAKVSVLSSAGKCLETKELGASVLAAARKLEYQPLVAEISYALGRLFDTCLDTKDALAYLEDAVMSAETAHHDEIAIEASVMLGSAYANLTRDVRMGRQWIRHGEAILARFQGHPLLEAQVIASRGNVLLREGRLDEALRDEQRALSIYSAALGPSTIEVAMSANNVAVVLHELGKDAEAAVIIQQAADTFSRVLGEETGWVALANANACEILTALGRFDAAKLALERALAIWRKQGAGDFFLGTGLLSEGRLRLAEKKPSAALAPLERSLQLIGSVDPHQTAEGKFLLARALVASSPRGRKQAVELAAAARELLRDDPSARRLLGEIDSWRAEHTRR